MPALQGTGQPRVTTAVQHESRDAEMSAGLLELADAANGKRLWAARPHGRLTSGRGHEHDPAAAVGEPAQHQPDEDRFVGGVSMHDDDGEG
jgi:hypothetical protein